jgi:hypothetical protein
MANAISSNLPSNAPAPRYAIDRVAAKIEPRLRALFRRLPAGVSLFTGGVFILVTVFLPLATDGCGHYGGTGKDLLVGKSAVYWPSLAGYWGGEFGRWFYLFLLAWAALAIAAALAPLINRDLSVRRSVIKPLAALAGAISFFVAADLCAWSLLRVGDSLWPAVEDSVGVLFFGLAPCIGFSALWAKGVRASRSLRLIFAILGATCGLDVALSVYVGATSADLAGPTSAAFSVVFWVVFLSPFVLCLLGPLAVWFRHGVWPMADSARYWPSLRRRLVLAYAPAVAGQIYVGFLAIFAVHVWGLVPCLLGIHLVTLGYLRLARRAEPALQSPVLSSQLSADGFRQLVTHNS